MIPDIGGGIGAKLVTASVVVAVALIVFFLVARAWRKRNGGLPPRGARHRGPRLAVLDTAAVDQRRRLILVRRDDVEHLIMIGGPTDLVIESRIGAEPVGSEAPQPVEAPVAIPTPEMQANPAPAAQEPAVAQREPIFRDEPVVAPVEEPTIESHANVPQSEPVSPSIERDEPDPAPHAERPAASIGALERERSRQADVASLLDSHRKRVLGEAPDAAGRSPIVRSYLDDDDTDMQRPPLSREVEPGPTSKPSSTPVLRFEDFLDPAITGDLSSARPHIAPDAETPPAAAHPVRQPSDGSHAAPVPQDDRATSHQTDASLDDEMARFLRQLSDKR